jgi:hypothetical protein
VPGDGTRIYAQGADGFEREAREGLTGGYRRVKNTRAAGGSTGGRERERFQALAKILCPATGRLQTGLTELAFTLKISTSTKFLSLFFRNYLTPWSHAGFLPIGNT